MISWLAPPTPKPRPPNLATPFALGPAALRPSQSLRVWTKFGGAWLRHRWGQPTNHFQILEKGKCKRVSAYTHHNFIKFTIGLPPNTTPLECNYY